MDYKIRYADDEDVSIEPNHLIEKGTTESYRVRLDFSNINDWSGWIAGLTNVKKIWVKDVESQTLVIDNRGGVPLSTSNVLIKGT